MNIFQKIKKQLKHALSEILLLEIFLKILIFKGEITEKLSLATKFLKVGSDF